MKQVTQHTFEMFLLMFTGRLYVKGSIDQRQIEWWSNGEIVAKRDLFSATPCYYYIKE